MTTTSETCRCWWKNQRRVAAHGTVTTLQCFGLGTWRRGCKISCQRLTLEFLPRNYALTSMQFWEGKKHEQGIQCNSWFRDCRDCNEMVCNLWCWKPFSSMKTQRSRQYTISESTGSFSTAFVPFHALFLCACLLTGKEPPQLACHPMKTLRHIFQSWQIQTMLTRFGYSLIQSVSL